MSVIEVSGLSKHYGSLRAVENVSFQVTEGSILGILGPNGAGKTTTLLERFGLANKRKSAVASLSGGQRQKLAIILALIGDPRLILLDELTTGLDPGARREIWPISRSSGKKDVPL